MFGPSAIQHAPAESYPQYFRAVLERGLLRRDRKGNYFLYHIFLGYYPKQKKSWPLYLQRPPRDMNLSFFEGTAQEFADYSPFDFVGLSNIFDWSAERDVRALASRLRGELRPGACVLYRQLNNAKKFESAFGPRFEWAKTEAARLQKKDRSLFYSSLHIGRKTA
jgi:S-adenosylmethionine-diacylglycerol 3-amino-3-carboxypropyl transferase